MIQKKIFNNNKNFTSILNLSAAKIRDDLDNMKNIEGFPNGYLEDMLKLSNPPHYTAYPNPYINSFIETFGTAFDESEDNYDISPFIDNESYGRTDSVYNIHFYHTKVPPQAINKYIEHYTKKNDIILDFFAGSGMTGVSSLRLGRYPILIDLSPFATSIEFNNLEEIDLDLFKVFAYNVFDSVFEQYSYLYDINGIESFQRNFTVWSEVQNCPFCKNDYLFFDAESISRSLIKCPICGAELHKNKLKCKLDQNGKGIFKPVEIHYIEGNKRKAIPVDDNEKKIINKIKNLNIPYWIPQNELPKGYNTAQPLKSHGYNEVKDFFTKRNMLIISAFFDEIQKYKIDDNYKKRLVYAITAAMSRLTIFNRYMPSHNRHVGPLSGTLYVPKLFAEINPFKNIKEKIDSILNAEYDYQSDNFIISTQSATDLKNIKDNSIDFIFIDPPFGENLMYSELNFIWESWLKNFTNNKEEAIINNIQNKGEADYYQLMYKSLKEANRVLKPNRWIMLEFHNSKAEIWKIIQESLVKSGFIIAQVLTLDKQKGTTKQLSYAGAVKNDLIINAYKPLNNFTNSFIKKAGLNMEYEFISMHLEKLPIEGNIERTHQMLYSKMLAQYIQNGFEVRMDAQDLYEMLESKFVERDGYWFTSNQALIYEKENRLDYVDSDKKQLILGVIDEKSAIIWLTQFLQNPKSYDEIHTSYLKSLMTSEDKIPELKKILEENFVTVKGKYKIPSNLEKKQIDELRTKKLNKEFKEILNQIYSSKKKIKHLRKEALRYGLIKLYQQKDIKQIKIIGEHIDKQIIESDEDISEIINWAKFK